MFNTDSIDIIENDIIRDYPALMKVLLFDRSTRKNIIWATDDYYALGNKYAPECEILPVLITGENSKLIQPRITKRTANQDARTRWMAEVFTPSWICNQQNNLIDEQWFGIPDLFNTVQKNSWAVNQEKIPFSAFGSRTWKKYVDARRFEVSCGEAPYLVSRYDTVTGILIPINARVGLLDRKLRVVNENAETDDEWKKWTVRAFQSVYGYEFQGDNLLIARENLLTTYVDYYQARFNTAPDKSELYRIAHIISWNLFQMDGLKYVVPFSCHDILEEDNQLSFLPVEPKWWPCPGCAKNDNNLHSGVYCRIMDWRSTRTLRYIDLMKGANDHD